MQNENTFDLNRAIQRWREHLAQSPALQRENLDELESHLRDSLAALQANRLSDEEAFMVAVKRIGCGDSLKAEFGKINGHLVWLDRALWLLLGVQLWTFVISMVGTISRSVISRGLILLNYDFEAHGIVFPVCLFVVANLSLFAASLLFCWWLLRRKGTNLGCWIGGLLQRRMTWGVTFGALCLLFAFNYLVWDLQVISLTWNSRGQVVMAISISSAISNLIQFLALLGITLSVARKRFQVSVGWRTQPA
jgi:hypothetical protein